MTMEMEMSVRMEMKIGVAMVMANVNGNGNGNEWQVPTIYLKHEMKTLTILDFFLSAIVLFALSLISLSLEDSLVAWS